MGLKDWRQRQLDRADRMTAWADQVDADLEVARQHRASGREAHPDSPRTDALDEWMHRRATQHREDHEDLAVRAKAVGMGLPTPERKMARRLGTLGALGELLIRDGSGAGGNRVDAYEAWRDRIVVEERMIAKTARGERLTRLDEVSLRIARLASK